MQTGVTAGPGRTVQTGVANRGLRDSGLPRNTWYSRVGAGPAGVQVSREAGIQCEDTSGMTIVVSVLLFFLSTELLGIEF
jgi:hypothetical protein